MLGVLDKDWAIVEKLAVQSDTKTITSSESFTVLCVITIYKKDKFFFWPDEQFFLFLSGHD